MFQKGYLYKLAVITADEMCHRQNYKTATILVAITQYIIRGYFSRDFVIKALFETKNENICIRIHLNTVFLFNLVFP